MNTFENIIHIPNNTMAYTDIVDNEMVLTEIADNTTVIISYIKEDELMKTSLIRSQILYLTINDGEKIVSSGQVRYNTILNDIFRHKYKIVMSNASVGNIEELEKEIIDDFRKLSKFNFKETNEKGKNGFHYKEDIRRSIQNKNATLTFRAIWRMIKAYKYDICFKIKTGTGNEIYFDSS